MKRSIGVTRLSAAMLAIVFPPLGLVKTVAAFAGAVASRKAALARLPAKKSHLRVATAAPSQPARNPIRTERAIGANPWQLAWKGAN
jgi:hypothetical protein